MRDRFDFYLGQVENLLTEAGGQADAARFLYENNLRTPLFMLEALSRIAEEVFRKKRFRKLRETFKQLEDLLGAVDYYDCFARQFSADKNIPAEVAEQLGAEASAALTRLGETLADMNGFPAEVRAKLETFEFPAEKRMVKELKDFYRRAVAGIVRNFGERSFTDLENDVHELRRALRWLSIYAQALGGTVQLIRRDEPENINKYLTAEILSSPFNKLPAGAGRNEFVLLDQARFLALSWMIAELGKLKDQGLAGIAVREATEAAGRKVRKNSRFDREGREILTRTDTLWRTYFEEGHLRNLVIGV